MSTVARATNRKANARCVVETASGSLINTVTRLVKDAIIYHEPRIKLDRLNVEESGDEPGLLLIRVHYTIRATNSRYNMVYPFYLEEAAFPG